MHEAFCYHKVYQACGEDNPMIGPFAEYLDKPKAILRETYTTTSKRWPPMLKAQSMVRVATIGTVCNLLLSH